MGVVMIKASLRTVCAYSGAGLALYAVLGANLAQAGTPTPGPLVGVVGGPVGFLAATVGFGGYLAIKHFRNRR
jgi:hypothetical protein